MAIPVAKRVRDVFYKHRASGMIGHTAVFVGMFTAELPYLLLVSVLYVLIYCATAGLLTTAANFGWFVLFFFLHTASYSFFAQCFMCLVKDEKTVGALQGVWIGLNLFYGKSVVENTATTSSLVICTLSFLFLQLVLLCSRKISTVSFGLDCGSMLRDMLWRASRSHNLRQ